MINEQIVPVELNTTVVKLDVWRFWCEVYIYAMACHTIWRSCFEVRVHEYDHDRFRKDLVRSIRICHAMPCHTIMKELFWGLSTWIRTRGVLSFSWLNLTGSSRAFAFRWIWNSFWDSCCWKRSRQPTGIRARYYFNGVLIETIWCSWFPTSVNFCSNSYRVPMAFLSGRFNHKELLHWIGLGRREKKGVLRRKFVTPCEKKLHSGITYNRCLFIYLLDGWS